MNSLSADKKPSTNDNNIEFGKRRYKRTMQTVGTIGVLLPIGSFPAINDFMAPAIMNLSVSETIFKTLLVIEDIVGPVRGLFVGLGILLIFSAWMMSRKERLNAQKRIDQINNMKAIESMDWRQFEEILADYYLLRGYRVTLVGGSGGGR